jgi:hypothetical protein
MGHSPEIRNRVIELEDRLERAQLRRTGFPGGFLLFLVLGFFLFRDEVQGVGLGTAGFAWIVAFGSACFLGLGVNELQTRRVIRATESELAALRAKRDFGEVRGQGRSAS